jgi:hypothetical protein
VTPDKPRFLYFRSREAVRPVSETDRAAGSTPQRVRDDLQNALASGSFVAKVVLQFIGRQRQFFSFNQK